MQHRKLFLAAAGAALAIALTACSGTGAPAGTPAGTASAPQESAVVETQTPAPEAESHTLQATLNSVDTGLDFLVAVDENGNYCRFNLGGVDADGLEPGDSIQIHSNESHNWLNFTNKTAKLLSINAPNPFKGRTDVHALNTLF